MREVRQTLISKNQSQEIEKRDQKITDLQKDKFFQHSKLQKLDIEQILRKRKNNFAIIIMLCSFFIMTNIEEKNFKQQMQTDLDRFFEYKKNLIFQKAILRNNHMAYIFYSDLMNSFVHSQSNLQKDQKILEYYKKFGYSSLDIQNLQDYNIFLGSEITIKIQNKAEIQNIKKQYFSKKQKDSHYSDNLNILKQIQQLAEQNFLEFEFDLFLYNYNNFLLYQKNFQFRFDNNKNLIESQYTKISSTQTIDFKEFYNIKGFLKILIILIFFYQYFNNDFIILLKVTASSIKQKSFDQIFDFYNTIDIIQLICLFASIVIFFVKFSSQKFDFVDFLAYQDNSNIIQKILNQKKSYEMFQQIFLLTIGIKAIYGFTYQRHKEFGIMILVFNKKTTFLKFLLIFVLIVLPLQLFIQFFISNYNPQLKNDITLILKSLVHSEAIVQRNYLRYRSNAYILLLNIVIFVKFMVLNLFLVQFFFGLLYKIYEKLQKKYQFTIMSLDEAIKTQSQSFICQLKMLFQFQLLQKNVKTEFDFRKQLSNLKHNNSNINKKRTLSGQKQDNDFCEETNQKSIGKVFLHNIKNLNLFDQNFFNKQQITQQFYNPQNTSNKYLENQISYKSSKFNIKSENFYNMMIFFINIAIFFIMIILSQKLLIQNYQYKVIMNKKFLTKEKGYFYDQSLFIDHIINNTLNIKDQTNFFNLQGYNFEADILILQFYKSNLDTTANQNKKKFFLQQRFQSSQNFQELNLIYRDNFIQIDDLGDKKISQQKLHHLDLYQKSIFKDGTSYLKTTDLQTKIIKNFKIMQKQNGKNLCNSIIWIKKKDDSQLQIHVLSYIKNQTGFYQQYYYVLNSGQPNNKYILIFICIFVVFLLIIILQTIFAIRGIYILQKKEDKNLPISYIAHTGINHYVQQIKLLKIFLIKNLKFLTKKILEQQQLLLFQILLIIYCLYFIILLSLYYVRKPFQEMQNNYQSDAKNSSNQIDQSFDSQIKVYQSFDWLYYFSFLFSLFVIGYIIQYIPFLKLRQCAKQLQQNNKYLTHFSLLLMISIFFCLQLCFRAQHQDHSSVYHYLVTQYLYITLHFYGNISLEGSDNNLYYQKILFVIVFMFFNVLFIKFFLFKIYFIQNEFCFIQQQSKNNNLHKILSLEKKIQALKQKILLIELHLIRKRKSNNKKLKFYIQMFFYKNVIIKFLKLRVIFLQFFLINGMHKTKKSKDQKLSLFKKSGSLKINKKSYIFQLQNLNQFITDKNFQNNIKYLQHSRTNQNKPDKYFDNTYIIDKKNYRQNATVQNRTNYQMTIYQKHKIQKKIKDIKIQNFDKRQIYFKMRTKIIKNIEETFKKCQDQLKSKQSQYTTLQKLLNIQTRNFLCVYQLYIWQKSDNKDILQKPQSFKFIDFKNFMNEDIELQKYVFQFQKFLTKSTQTNTRSYCTQNFYKIIILYYIFESQLHELLQKLNLTTQLNKGLRPSPDYIKHLRKLSQRKNKYKKDCLYQLKLLNNIVTLDQEILCQFFFMSNQSEKDCVLLSALFFNLQQNKNDKIKSIFSIITQVQQKFNHFVKQQKMYFKKNQCRKGKKTY